jgi:hypothetical protein
MKQELDQQLCEKYPKIFVNRHGSVQETCMCWGFSHGDGWYNIINQLCANIQSHIDWSNDNYKNSLKYNAMIKDMQVGNFDSFNEYMSFGTDEFKDKRRNEILESGPRKLQEPCPQVIAEQVKEKFGTLRFYYQGGDAYVNGLVRMAESMTSVTCESCGVPANTSNHNGWIGTLCNDCITIRNTERNAYNQMDLNFTHTIKGEDDGYHD